MAESTLKYNALSAELQARIEEDRARGWVNPYRAADADIQRRNPERDRPNLWRPAYVRDIEKILHLPVYNRYADKTQVFSFYNNDDITRRALHVQLVSRIARNIGAVLGLNLDLIEAVALGHDIGHTPFGHAGERFLDALLTEACGQRFLHNVHSVRVLDRLFQRNISLQTLDGVLCHNGEFEVQALVPVRARTFSEFDAMTERCRTEGDDAAREFVSMTLEGCVVRLCDMVAYLGKDRQDARTAHIIPPDYPFTVTEIGVENAAMINNMTVDILENSYGRDCIAMSAAAYSGLKTAKRENYQAIYQNDALNAAYDEIIGPMFKMLYSRLRDDLVRGDKSAVVYRHHVRFTQNALRYYKAYDYLKETPDQIVTDYIASMTDDYFLALFRELFPESGLTIEYKSYFEA